MQNIFVIFIPTDFHRFISAERRKAKLFNVTIVTSLRFIIKKSYI